MRMWRGSDNELSPIAAKPELSGRRSRVWCAQGDAMLDRLRCSCDPGEGLLANELARDLLLAMGSLFDTLLTADPDRGDP